MALVWLGLAMVCHEVWRGSAWVCYVLAWADFGLVWVGFGLAWVGFGLASLLTLAICVLKKTIFVIYVPIWSEMVFL